MGYYVRAFCTTPAPPAVSAILQFLRQREFDFTAQIDDPSDLDSSAWRQLELVYKPQMGPIVVECDRLEGDDSLVKAECEEFMEEIAELDDTPAKARVVDHLRNTRFIVSCQLLSDIDDDGYEANGQFLNYFVDHCGAIIQADGEGFYKSPDLEDLLLPLE